MMTQAEREAAYERVRRALGVDQIGTGPDARPLPSRRGREPQRGSALAIESEVYAAAERVMAALGAGRLGLTDDAPMLQPLPGSGGMAPDPFPVGQELAWIGGHYGYGEVWGRPGLELRTRCFLTMAILQVMHENDQ